MFPSDTELVKRFQVSRGTVREAIKLLFRQGYLVREQGKGTFVTYRKIQQNPDTLIGFTELMEKHNIKPSAKLLTRKEMPAPEKTGNRAASEQLREGLGSDRIGFGISMR